MLAQFLGAFAGAAIVYGVYFEALREVEEKFFDGARLVNATAGIFATYPQPHLSIGGGFIDQVPSEILLHCCSQFMTVRPFFPTIKSSPFRCLLPESEGGV